MCTQKLAGLAMRAPCGVALTHGRITEVERAVGPDNGMGRPRSDGATAML
ncbi:hypothetical protein FJ972_07720 [Mesorhizobium sp. B2-1-1]|nr:hypothetical protein [Mesorhizobium sp. B2-1-1]UCI14736.1 hypothetical protein FJ972_07720 [Mesorhizobium sp. B2-1-1]